MIKMVFCIKKRADISDEEFYHYWLNEHGPLVESLAEDLGIEKYVQSHRINEAHGRAVSAARDLNQEGYDGVAELWWHDNESIKEVAKSDKARKANLILQEDEAKFIDMGLSTIFYTEEHELISPN